MLYAKDLVEKEDPKKDVYKLILEDCYRKIKAKHKQNIKFFTFVIPFIRLGFPLYNMNEALKYIFKKLKKGGFQVQVASENSLYISW